MQKPQTTEQRAERRDRTQAWLDVGANVTDLLEHLSDGNNLWHFCQANDFLYSRVQRFLSEHHKELYRATRLSRAEILMAEIEVLEEKLEGADKDEAKALESAIKSKQWRIMKLNPGEYSDRQQIAHTHLDLNRQHLDALRLVANAPRKQLPTIPSEPVPVAAPQPAEPVVDAEFTSPKSTVP